MAHIHTYTSIRLVSWILEITIDTPSKKFSNELDIQCRNKRPPERPPPPKNPKTVTEDGDDKKE